MARPQPLGRPATVRFARYHGACRLAVLSWFLWVVVSEGAYEVDFEGERETKGTYASATVSLGGLDWMLTEALIGTLANDKKNGMRALRIRRDGDTAGLAEMRTDKACGIGTVSFLYAAYGAETGQPRLLVEYSTDAGVSWSPAGTAIEVFPESLTPWSATLNVAGYARIRLRTDTSGTNQRRINIDDLMLTDFHDGTPWVDTTTITDITPAGARVVGEAIDDCGQPVSWRGVAWSASHVPTTNDTVLSSGMGMVFFTNTLTGLVAGETYFVRAFAVNDTGVGYGRIRTFRTADFTNAPVMAPVTNRHSGGFTTTWSAVEGATHYLLDISADNRFHTGGTGTVMRETFGDVDSARSVADHYLAGGFDGSADYTYCGGGIVNTGEVRTTSSSSGYIDPAGHPASGGANIWFTGVDGDYGFCIGGIDPRPYRDLQIGVAYRKESASLNATFELAWSGDAGITWQAIPVTGLPPADAGTGWYPIGGLALPAETETVDDLRFRWVKRGTTAMRLDDVVLFGDGGPSQLHPRFTAIPVTGTTYRGDRLRPGIWWVRVRAVGAADCISAPSKAQAVKVIIGGTVAVFK